MPANTRPIYSILGSISNDSGTGMNQAILTAANDYTGIGANNSLIFTAGPAGSLISRIRAKAIGTNTASVARFFFNNGSAVGTATNNVFWGELALPATTISAVGPTIDLEYPVGFAIPAGFRLYVGLGTTVAAGWVFMAIAGEY